jgi:hypothetical protein
MTSTAGNSLPADRLANQTNELPRELAELQAKSRADETEIMAKANFSALSEASKGVKRAALTDYNRRIIRQADTMDDWYARTIYKAYGTAADYETLEVNTHTGWSPLVLQCKHCERMHNKIKRDRSWKNAGEVEVEDLAEYKDIYCRDDDGHPNLCVNCRCVVYGGDKGDRFIGIERSSLWRHRQKLINGGILIPLGQERQGIGTLDPGQFDAGRFQVRAGLTLIGGAIRHHNFTAALPDGEPDKPNDRRCQHCKKDISDLKVSAKHCGPSCRQAARRARVTETEHGMQHGMQHGVQHGMHDVTRKATKARNAMSDSSSALRAAAGDDETHQPSKVLGEGGSGRPSDRQAEPRPGSRSQGSASQHDRAMRDQAKEVIRQLQEVAPHYGLAEELGWRTVAGLLGRFSAQVLVDATKWAFSDYYEGKEYVSNPDSRAALLMSQLGRLAQEWIDFRLKYDFQPDQTYADFAAAMEAREAAQAAEDEDDEPLEAPDEEAASADDVDGEAGERAAKLAAEEQERERQRRDEASPAEAERTRARDELIAERATRPHWFVDHDDRTYRRAVGRGRPRRGEIEFVGEEAELLATWPQLRTQV